MKLKLFYVTLMIGFALLFIPLLTEASIITFNSAEPADNAATRADWLSTIDISTPQYLVDFEGPEFSAGQNVSGVAGLFPGGLVITDTTSSNSAIIQASPGYLGGANPVGTLSLTHNEGAFLELDFEVNPVDYLAFQDIDQNGTSGIVTFTDGTTERFSLESAGTAEFFGIYRNDMPLIANVMLDASGDGEWGIDTIEYGVGQGHSSPLPASPNNAPFAPSATAPENGAILDTLTPVLRGTPFNDPDQDDYHVLSRWEISTMPDFTGLVFQADTDVHLTAMTVPYELLHYNMTYYWRVRYYDNQRGMSEWSFASSFQTPENLVDLDDNGMPDDQQNETADLNEDGIPDIEQTDLIKTVNTATGECQMGVALLPDNGVTDIQWVEAIHPDDIHPIHRPDLPIGLLGARLIVAPGHAQVQIRVYFCDPAPADVKWWYYNAISGWMELNGYAQFSPDRIYVDVTLEDGGLGDADGLQNGVIVDPGGFGVVSWVKLKVTDENTGSGIPNAKISLDGVQIGITAKDGTCKLCLQPAICSLQIEVNGYAMKTQAITIEEAQSPEVIPVELSKEPSTSNDEPQEPNSSTGDGGGSGGGGGGCFIRTIRSN